MNIDDEKLQRIRILKKKIIVVLRMDKIERNVDLSKESKVVEEIITESCKVNKWLLSYV